MQTCVILNPSARGDKARALHADLERAYPHCVFRHSSQAGHARELAAQAVRDGFPTIIAGGGDGTVNEVINGLGDVSGGFESTDFGVLPLGTVNVFAREIGLPLRLKETVEVLKKGKTRTIDLGRAEYIADGAPQQRFFIQLAGAGLDSRAIELVDWQLKKKMGAASYVVAGIQALLENQPRIVARGATELSGELVLIGNGRFYGGSFTLFPKATLQDGLLHVLMVPKVTWLRAMAGGVGLLAGKLAEFCDASLVSLPSVKLTSASRVLFQLDGENIGELPATLSVKPKTLRVIVP